MKNEVRRISIMIGENQYQAISDKGLNLSGLIRTLLDDYLSSNKITLAVSEKTHDLYHRIMSNAEVSDAAIEPYLMEGFKEILSDHIDKMKKLSDSLEND